MSWERTFRWLRRRHITAFEWLLGGLHIWWSAALLMTHGGRTDSSPLYFHMTSIAPWWFWVAAALAAPLMVVVFAATQCWAVLYVSLFWKASYWAAIGVLTWQLGHSLLSPSVLFVFAMGPAWRYAEVRVSQDTDGG